MALSRPAEGSRMSPTPWTLVGRRGSAGRLRAICDVEDGACRRVALASLPVVVPALRPEQEQPHNDCGAGDKQPPEGAAHHPTSSVGGHRTPAASARPTSRVPLIASDLNVTVRGSIARLASVDRPSAYQTGGQFEFAKNDLVRHHFLGTHVRQQHGTHSKRGRGRARCQRVGRPVRQPEARW